MMPVPVHLTATAARIRTTKEQLVATTSGRPDQDLTPRVTVIRDRVVIALVVAPTLDVRIGLDAAKAAAVGYAADELILSVDAHMSHSGTNPRTGQPWLPGEIQALRDAEGCDEGLVTDTMVSTWANRTGQLAMWTDPYQVDEATRTVIWTSPSGGQLKVEQPRFTLGGRVPATLRAVMRAATLVERTGVPQAVADHTTTLELLEHGVVVFAADALGGPGG